MTLAPDERRRPHFGPHHRLVLARHTAGLEQTDLAHALDVSRGTISNMERGITRPNRLQLREWALVCGVDLEWLQNGDAPAPAPGGGGSFAPALGLRAYASAALAQSAERFTRNEEWNGSLRSFPRAA